MTDPNLKDENYNSLECVLEMALHQASSGKGKDRHANGKAFKSQPIMEIARMVGVGYQTGQVMKKAQEATSMTMRGDNHAAIQELLGVIVYSAAAVILIQENSK